MVNFAGILIGAVGFVVGVVSVLIFNNNIIGLVIATCLIAAGILIYNSV